MPDRDVWTEPPPSAEPVADLLARAEGLYRTGHPFTGHANDLLSNLGDLIRSTYPVVLARRDDPRTLARLVKNETGMTFGRWRQQLHIVIALQRLSAGARVQQVAEELGYESVTAFITMFKKALGKPPARYFADRQNGHED